MLSDWNSRDCVLEVDEYPLATVFRDKDGNKIIAADNAHVKDLDDMR